MKKQKVINFRDKLSKKLKDKDFAVLFEKERELVQIGYELSKLRKSKRLTQNQLAEMINTKQQAISRLENAVFAGCSINTLIKIAAVTHKHLKVEFIDDKELQTV